MLSDDPRSPFGSARAVVRAFLADRRGATAVEYGLFCAMLGVIAVTGGAAMREAVVALYDRILAGMATR